MIISRSSIRSGLLIGLAMSFVAVIGMLQVFAERFIVADTPFTLSNIILLGVILAAGFYAARQARLSDPLNLAVNGAIAGGVLAIVVIIAVFLATQINIQADAIDMTTVFPNVNDQLVALLSFQQESVLVGYLLLFLLGAVGGAIGAWITLLPAQVRSMGLFSVVVVVVIGMLQDQINTIISFPDALGLTILVAVGYAVAERRDLNNLIRRLAESAVAGAVLGALLALLLLATGANSGTVPEWIGSPPPPILASLILGKSAPALLILLTIVGGALGATGAALSSTSGTTHRTGITILVSLLTLGILNGEKEMTLLAAIATIAIMVAAQFIMARTAARSHQRLEKMDARQRRTSQTVIGLAGLAFILLIPQLLTGYINNVVDLIGLYVMMGLGLNIVVGFAGLLDLGYVAFFTIGAYTTGVLTTPNFVTCPPPSDNVVVVQQALADEGALEEGYAALTDESIGVVNNTRAAYAALTIPQAELVRFEDMDAAMNALSAGEVAAVVGAQEAVTPYLEGTGLQASEPFTPELKAWPARLFDATEKANWCSITTFWVGWIAAVLAAGLAGVLLGIPVLRLRGDYLAIVTLGFGEIIRLVALSDLFKPYLGGAQGIVSIPSPVIDLTAISPALANSGVPLLTQIGQGLALPITLSRPSEVYYLILFGILVTAFISYRLSHSRLGRSWRAMREDEAVAQAMGVNLVRTKLLAFSIGAAFAGVGGAIFGSYIKSIFPNSFTLMVSINVLSLIIIGGMGSLPGVFIGALVVFGLPEALREFQEFRLLMFGALLVVMMLLRPEGVMPPATPRLEEQAEKAFAEEKA